MYFEKWLNKEIFYRNIFVSIVYSIIMIIISLILLLVDTSIIYGSLIGVTMLWVTNLLIWLLWFKIPKIKSFMNKITPIGVWIIRMLIFITMFLIIILYINPSLSDFSGLKLVMEPINLFALMVTYSINTFSYLTIIIIDVFISIKETKKGKENKK